MIIVERPLQGLLKSSDEERMAYPTETLKWDLMVEEHDKMNKKKD